MFLFLCECQRFGKTYEKKVGKNKNFLFSFVLFCGILNLL